MGARAQDIECVEHPGVVQVVRGEMVRVAINRGSACSGCHARGSCGLVDGESRIVEAPCDGHRYRVGDQVVVRARVQQGLWAVLLSYVMPWALLVVTLFVLLGLGVGEGLAALGALGVLLPYYLVVWSVRPRLEKRIAFHITIQE